MRKSIKFCEEFKDDAELGTETSKTDNPKHAD